MIKKIVKSKPSFNTRNLYYFLFFLSSLSLLSCKAKITSLPYLGVHTAGERFEEGKMIPDTSYYEVPAFSMMNQDSSFISENTIENKVYVSYFFFTSCPATCPIMTDAMKRVYKIVGEEKDFMVLAHTVDPKRDTPEKLKDFSIKNAIDKSNWHFLTGEMDYIYELGMKGYYLSMGKHDAAPGGYIHSAKFILVDKDRHIRGFYEGTDANDVAKMIEGIQFLLSE